MTEYTDIYKGFQIRDVCYLGDPPKDGPIKFDIVKWQEFEPREILDAKTGKKKTTTRSCYSVATLVYNPKEPDIEFHSVGLRWLEEHPDPDVEEWVIKCAYKLHELLQK